MGCHQTQDGPTNPPDSQVDAARIGRRLEYFTVGWNVIEAIVAISAGWVASSILLIGFGADSVVESLSGAILLWRLHAPIADERREVLALKGVGISFFLLAAYVATDAAVTLASHKPPEASMVGLVLAGLSVIIMPMLARAKRRVAGLLASQALHADSRQTDLCAWLSAIVLAGVGLNALLGWWWADPLAALLLTPIICREGWLSFRGQTCCACS